MLLRSDQLDLSLLDAAKVTHEITGFHENVVHKHSKNMGFQKCLSQFSYLKFLKHHKMV